MIQDANQSAVEVPAVQGCRFICFGGQVLPGHKRLLQVEGTLSAASRVPSAGCRVMNYFSVLIPCSLFFIQL